MPKSNIQIIFYQIVFQDAQISLPPNVLSHPQNESLQDFKESVRNSQKRNTNTGKVFVITWDVCLSTDYAQW